MKKIGLTSLAWRMVAWVAAALFAVLTLVSPAAADPGWSLNVRLYVINSGDVVKSVKLISSEYPEGVCVATPAFQIVKTKMVVKEHQTVKSYSYASSVDCSGRPGQVGFQFIKAPLGNDPYSGPAPEVDIPV